MVALSSHRFYYQIRDLRASGSLLNGAEGRFIANHTPGWVKTAQDLGAEDPSKVIDVTILLNLHNRDEVITFGTDTHLQTTVGWDNVTGMGTPNGKAFADYFNPARANPVP